MVLCTVMVGMCHTLYSLQVGMCHSLYSDGWHVSYFVQ